MTRQRRISKAKAKKKSPQARARPRRPGRELPEGKLRLVIELPAATHRAVKLRAVEQGQSIRDYIIELLRADGLKL